MSKPNKGRRRSSGAGKGAKEHGGDKKASGATTSTDKKAPDATEKKTTGPKSPASPTSPASPASPASPTSPTSPGTSQPPGAQASAAGNASKKQPAAADKKESTMKPTESKGSLISKAEPAKTEPAKLDPAKKEPAKTEPAKTEPAKSTQPTKPADSHAKQPKDHATPKSPTKPSGATAPAKQPSGGKAPTSQGSKPNEAKPKEATKTKEEKSSVAPTSSKPAPESKKEKKAAVVGAAAAAAVAGGAATAAVVSTNKSEATKGEKKPLAASTASPAGMDDALDELMGTLEGPEEVPKTPEYTGPVISDPSTSVTIKKLGEDDNTIPPEYRHLLDGKDSSGNPIKPEAPATPMGEEDLVMALSSDFTCASSPDKKKQKLDEPKPQEGGLDSALDELMGTLEGPEETVPETTTYTGPEITEAVTSETIDPLGIHDGTIPPAYRHLLDGKVDGKDVPAPKPESPAQPIGEEDLVDALSSGFTYSAPPASTKEEVDEGTVDDSALDELMGTLEGAGDPVPESPAYTGPVVTETNTATYIEELGKRESSIPPEYRKLLDGKEGGKVAPTPEPVKPLSDADLADQLSKDFSSSSPSTVKPAAVPAPKGSVEPKKSEPAPSEEITTCATVSSVQSAPAPAKVPAPAKLPPSKAPAPSDPLDALSATLGKGDQKPADTKPVVDKVKEKTGKEGVEKLGEREDTKPPEYRLQELKDKDGKPILPKTEAKPKPLSDVELADAFAGDFVTATATTTQSAPVPAAKKAPAPSDPLDALSATLGKGDRKPADTKPVVDKVKEKTGKEGVEKLGEREDTKPPEYRLQELKDKDGKPILPKPEAKPKPLSDVELADAFAGDFVTATATTTQSAPVPAAKGTVKSKDTPSKEVVSSSAASTVKSAAVPAPAAKGAAPADPLDSLAGTLGKAEPPPKDTKPAVDKVKEKTGKEKGEKLGEREDTIPPDYRLTETKDKDGKPMMPKAEEKPKPMSDTELLDALTEGFVTSPSPQQSAPPAALKKDAKKSAGSEEVVACSKASSVQASAPPAATADESISDDALDLLSGTLGKREVDPDENKPMVDKVKEKATKEHIAKLGECDETIPPEYRALLDGDGKNKPVTPTIPEKPKGPHDDTAAIDALSKGFCPASPVESATQPPKDKSAKDSAPSKPASKDEAKTKELPKDKSGKDAPATKPAAKEEVKAKGPEKTKEQSSALKSDNQKTSKS